MADRTIPKEVGDAIARARPASFVREYSTPLEVYFPAADSPIDVPHGMNAIPDGYLVLWQDALVIRAPGAAWSREVAYLQAETDHARACVVFLLLTETPRYVGPTA